MAGVNGQWQAERERRQPQEGHAPPPLIGPAGDRSHLGEVDGRLEVAVRDGPHGPGERQVAPPGCLHQLQHPLRLALPQQQLHKRHRHQTAHQAEHGVNEKLQRMHKLVRRHVKERLVAQ